MLHFLDRDVPELPTYLQKKTKKNIEARMKTLKSYALKHNINVYPNMHLQGRLYSLQSKCEKTWIIIGLDTSEKGEKNKSPEIFGENFWRNYFEEYSNPFES